MTTGILEERKELSDGQCQCQIGGWLEKPEWSESESHSRVGLRLEPQKERHTEVSKSTTRCGNQYRISRMIAQVLKMGR